MVFNRKYYKICFIVYMFINTLALGYLGIETNYLFIPMLLWAVVIIVRDLYKKEIRIKDSYSFLMIGQGLVLFLATLRSSYSDLNSYVIALMQLVIYFVVFTNRDSMNRKRMKEEISAIIPLVNILVGVASLISIGMFVVRFSSVANGWTLGMVGNRLFGVYFNCNPASFLACITIVLALIAIREKFKGRILYFINIGIQFIYILLAKCRSSLIILIVIVIMIAYYFLIRRRKYSFTKRLFLISCLCVTITTAGLLSQKIVEVIPRMQGVANQETSRFQMDKVVEALRLCTSGNMKDFNAGLNIIDEVSNGRISLTKTALEIWQKEPIIGIGANNFKKIGKKETTTLEYWAVQVVHSHNVFLEALVTSGLVGFVLFLIFVLKFIVMVFKLLKRSQGTEGYFIVQMFLMIVLSEFIGSLSDYGVFYIYSLSATLAWCFGGYLFTMERILKKERNRIDAKNIS